MKVLCFGSLNLDHTYQVERFLKPGETRSASGYEIHAGGKGLNQAAAACITGAAVSLIGAVGGDDNGRFILDAVREYPINTDYLTETEMPTGTAVILVDEDVDIFDPNDVLWAMNTRFQGDRDIITIPGVRCHPLDPSSNPDYSPSISDIGVSCKTIFDCTVPFHLKERFQRVPFLDVDPERWLHG